MLLLYRNGHIHAYIFFIITDHIRSMLVRIIVRIFIVIVRIKHLVMRFAQKLNRRIKSFLWSVCE